MTFIEVMLATILGQLILAAVLGIIKGFTNALRERQKKKLNKSANDLLDSLNKLKDVMDDISKKEKEGKKDE